MHWLYGIILSCFLSMGVSAMDTHNQRRVSEIALAAERNKQTLLLPWFGYFHLENNPERFVFADGQMIYHRPSLVRSYYDPVIVHSLAHFYRLEHPRINLLMHYAGRHAGEVFSFGFDSGIASDKLTLQPAFFIGYTHALALGDLTHLTFALGGWFGGGLSERACMDAYGRAYWCPALIAWTDYRPDHPSLSRYIRFLLTHRF